MMRPAALARSAALSLRPGAEPVGVSGVGGGGGGGVGVCGVDVAEVVRAQRDWRDGVGFVVVVDRPRRRSR